MTRDEVFALLDAAWWKKRRGDRKQRVALSVRTHASNRESYGHSYTPEEILREVSNYHVHAVAERNRNTHPEIMKSIYEHTYDQKIDLQYRIPANSY